MNPKCIIIKTQSKDFFNAILYKLKEFNNIRFFHFKLNGFYTLTIKCHTYYNKMNIMDKTKLYGSYIFLYSIISIILSELLMIYYEPSVSKRIIVSKKNNQINLHKLSTISSLLLDENSPFEFSKPLFKKRKNFILISVLKNFRIRNYIFIDYFLDFCAKEYIKELEEIIDTSIEILNNKILYDYMMNYIFQNNSWFLIIINII